MKPDPTYVWDTSVFNHRTFLLPLDLRYTGKECAERRSEIICKVPSTQAAAQCLHSTSQRKQRQPGAFRA